MEIPCVRVPREQGEAVRSSLAEADIIHEDYEIEATDDWLYIPVTTTKHLPDTYEIVRRTPRKRSQQVLPGDILGYSPRYERLGDIALIDEGDTERAQEIADALVASDIPVSSVLNRQSKISGRYRVRDWALLAGDSTETLHREFGVKFRVDVTETYFSPRLATERNRVIDQVSPDERVIDMFAGVGPFIIPMACRGADVVGVDINDVAIDYLEANAALNDVSERVTAIHGDVREIGETYAGWADRLIMNLPHSAQEFLPTAKRLASDRCRLHYYDIQHEDAPFAPGKSAIREVFDDEYAISVEDERIVRSYAPHEVNVCLDIDVHTLE